MRNFLKQFIFILIALAIIGSGALIIYSATPQGKINVKPSKTEKLKVVNQQTATSSINNPVAWWKFDEGTGQYAYDSSGNGNTGTLTNGPAWTTGKLGKGLRFDGYLGGSASSYVIVSVGSIKTISFWVYLFGDNDSGVFGFSTSTITWNRMGVSSGGVSMVLESKTVVNVSYNVRLNTWRHIVVIDNGSNYLVYIDGVLQNNTASFYCPFPVLNRIGCANYNNSCALPRVVNGTLDDIRVYDRILSATEVAQLYNSTKDGYLGKVKASTGLVGYWKLDDNTSTATVIDYSGKNNNGVFYDSGSATSTSLHSTTTAVVARAMVFDGVNDYVDIGTPWSLEILGDISLSAWIKNTSSGNQHIISNYANSGPYTYYLGVKNGKGTIGIGADIDYPTVTSLSTVNDGLWHHITGVRLGKNVKIYIDGVLNNSGTYSGNAPSYRGLSSKIGAASYLPHQQYFNGLIDEVRIYNRALSAEEIKQLYERGRNGLP